MELYPFANETGSTGRKLSVEGLTSGDCGTRSMLAKERIKVRGRMILRKHPDHDAIELTDCGH